MPHIDENLPFRPLAIAVLTVSDTRTIETDKSGQYLRNAVKEAGHTLVASAIVKDEIIDIRYQVQSWLDDNAIDVVITTGGTGFSHRDVTPDALSPLFEKQIDGFSAIFHMKSFDKIGTSTLQSRACAGLANETLIFCVPGSTGACKDAWQDILKWQLDSRHRPCNFVEILPKFITN